MESREFDTSEVLEGGEEDKGEEGSPEPVVGVAHGDDEGGDGSWEGKAEGESGQIYSTASISVGQLSKLIVRRRRAVHPRTRAGREGGCSGGSRVGSEM